MSDIRFNQWLHQSGTGGVSQVASGAVGVGTTNPLADFYVRGDAQITGILTAGHIAMGSSITFGDDNRAYFGDDTDLQVYHNNSHAFVANSTGHLTVTSSQINLNNAANTKNSAIFRGDSNVELFYNHTKRFETTNTGAVVTGILTATSFVGGLPIAGGANDRVITASSASAIQGEANLTFNGSKLVLAANSTAYDAFQVGDGLFIGNTTNNVSAAIFHQGGGADLEIGAQDMITFTTGSTAGNATERLRITSTGNITFTGPSNSFATIQYASNFTKLDLRGNGIANSYHYILSYGAGHGEANDFHMVNKTTNGALAFRTGSSTDERLRITSDGKVGINDTTPAEMLDVGGAIQASGGFKTAGHPIATYASFTDISGGSYATRLGSTGTSTLRSTQIYGGGDHIATFDGVNKRLGINLTVPTAKLHVSAAYNETGTTITGGALGYNDVLQCNTANGHRRFTVAGDGEIYGPSGGRKNWFDNGSFDCIGGRRNATSMDYGNHHAYGWVTDRFMSRNSVQWTRSTNVPTGKGFSYSTQTNGAGGQIMQAVELPDYGDMGVFTPGSYWCVSIWSTVGMNHSGSAFSYDLGSTRTDVTGVGSGSYATTGETAAGTSTGTFNRYYRVYGPMPSSIISGATGLYFQWGFTAAGYATGWQLERVPTSTSKPTPYEHVHPAVTTARCRRYCWQNVNSRLHNGYKRHDSNIHWEERFPVPPTHMPSGSNQSVTPYGIILHDGGLLSNFQSVLQNPGVNSVSISEFDYRSGRFIIVGSTSYSPTHVTVPAWESQEYEIIHGFF